MSQKFPAKKFVHVTTSTRVEGEVVLESSTGWQVAVGGKVQVLAKSEWSEVRDGTTFGAPEGKFDDLFGMMFGGR